MLKWGACWGAFIGLLWGGWASDFTAWQGAVWGAAAGALFGLSLRAALRREWQELQAKQAGQGTKAPQPQAQQQTQPQAQAQPIPAPTQPARQRLLAPTKPPQVQAQVHTQGQDPASWLAPAPADIQAGAAPEAAHTALHSKPHAAVPQTPAWLQNSVSAWFTGGNAVVRLGFLLLFIGLAFLAKFAADAGLFPPALRMAGLAVLGAVFLGLGWRLRQKWAAHQNGEAGADRRLAYAYTLQGAGVAVLYLTIFAAFRLYGLLDSTQAFALLLLVCAGAAALALLQNAAAMAFIGFAGGYAAPILLSTGSNAIGTLLAYYLLLNVGVVLLAYARAWRGLNLLGFFASFGVLCAWVAQHYQPSDYGLVQPYVLAYFALYVLAALFYALRHQLAARQAVDATLVFGVPTASMGLEFKLMQALPHGAAWAALAMALLYLALFLGLQPKAASGGQMGVTARWLRQSYAALALVLFTVALALGLDAPWTAAMWALEGLAVYWVGRRQGSAFARGMGLALQGLAAWVFVDAHIPAVEGALLHPRLWGLLVLALSAWGVCALLQRPQPALAQEAGLLERMVRGLEGVAAPPLFLLGGLWWCTAGVLQLTYCVPQADFCQSWIGGAYQTHSLLLFFALSAWGVHHWARSSCAARLPIAALPLWLLLPTMLGFAIYEGWKEGFFVQNLGWLAWPAALALYLHGLRGLDGSRQGQYKNRWALQHAGVVFLALLLLWQLTGGLVDAQNWRSSDWPEVLNLLAATALLAALLRRRHWAATFAAPDTGGQAWPWQPYGRVYLQVAAGVLAAGLLFGVLALGLHAAGDTPPLPFSPYLPVFNPVDASLLISLGVLALYARRLQGVGAGWARGLAYACAGVGFVALNSLWLRMVHHYWGVAWQADALFDSFITQAGYSILWTVLALGAMWWAARRSRRPLWLAGAGLLGITVAKLFLVDLSNSGGAERIISFIAVGGLMLVLGYFAPLPKAASPASTEVEPL